MRNIISGASVLVAIIACGQSMQVSAREYYYFYKAATNREAYVADRVECERLTGGVSRRSTGLPSTYYMPQNPNLTTGQNALAAGLAGLFAGLITSSETRRTTNAVERTCMADKGYARYEVDKAVVQEIEKLDSVEARVERYFNLATAAVPLGERIKE